MAGKKGPRPKERPAGRQADDLLWGIHSVGEALTLRPRSLSEILVQKGKSGSKIQQIVDQARLEGIKLRFCEAGRMGVDRSCNHQGVVARQSPVEYLGLEELLSECIDREGKVLHNILVLDSIQDPRNLGSILRSALAAGFRHVILTRERSVPVTGTVARTSAGAVVQLRLCQVVNLAEALKRLKGVGYWVFAAVVDRNALELYAADFSGSVCLVIGSEGKGIRPLVKKQCDHQVTIPMHGGFNSLNASVAAALMMFEVRRQQR